MSQFGESNLDTRARKALLDALSALEPHLESLILIGAQAVYLHTGSLQLAVAPFTSDADLLFDSQSLGDEPEISAALRGAGFTLDPLGSGAAGNWISSEGVPVDLMLARSQSNRSPKARAAHLSTHHKGSVRIADGLDSALEDRVTMTIESFDVSDSREFQVSVAGPAALLIAKLFKIGERLRGSNRRLISKDALDVYRLLGSFPPGQLAVRFDKLLDSPAATREATLGLDLLVELFSKASAPGNELLAAAVKGLEDETKVIASATELSNSVIELISKGK
jgi:hypothetical protein